MGSRGQARARAGILSESKAKLWRVQADERHDSLRILRRPCQTLDGAQIAQPSGCRDTWERSLLPAGAEGLDTVR